MPLQHDTPNMPEIADILDRPALYKLWQAPFARAKFAPVLRHNRLDRVRRVLDIGCGPGINTRYFEGTRYVGIDLNAEYVAYASCRHDATFVVADVRERLPVDDERFDFILSNSLMHHIDDDGVRSILSTVARRLTPDGHVHILDLVLPLEPGIDRWLALHDRGEYPRALEDWRSLFEEQFEPVVLEPYPIGLMGVPLWNMVYFKGRPKEQA